MVYGRPLTVKIAPPRGGGRVDTARRQSDSTLKIFVCNLPTQVDHSRLEQLFSKHGKVVDARVIYESRGDTCCSRGFGFVTMASEEESHNAIHALNKQVGLTVCWFQCQLESPFRNLVFTLYFCRFWRDMP
jgi:nucleolin